MKVEALRACGDTATWGNARNSWVRTTTLSELAAFRDVSVDAASDQYEKDVAKPWLASASVLQVLPRF